MRFQALRFGFPTAVATAFAITVCDHGCDHGCDHRPRFVMATAVDVPGLRDARSPSPAHASLCLRVGVRPRNLRKSPERDHPAVTSNRHRSSAAGNAEFVDCNKCAFSPSILAGLWLEEAATVKSRLMHS